MTTVSTVKCLYCGLTPRYGYRIYRLLTGFTYYICDECLANGREP